MMEIVKLPEGLVRSSHAIDLFDYRASLETSRQKVVLTKHAFSFLTEGEKEVITDTRHITVSNESFLMMRAGHCLMTERFSASNGYRSVLLFFTDENVRDFLAKHPVSRERGKAASSVEVLHYDGFLRNYVESLASLRHLTNHQKSKILETKFEELLLYLIETAGEHLLWSLLGTTDSQTQRFVQLVEQNKHNKLNLKELAFLSNMSVSTFKRVFQKHFGESPIKWFQERRLEYAAHLLRSESRRPSEIYALAGFESLSNFIQAFKVKYGTTPKQYQLD